MYDIGPPSGELALDLARALTAAITTASFAKNGRWNAGSAICIHADTGTAPLQREGES